jgi:hypothetical protein
VDIQKNWRPIETAQRFSMAHPKSLQPTLAVTLWPVPYLLKFLEWHQQKPTPFSDLVTEVVNVLVSSQFPRKTGIINQWIWYDRPRFPTGMCEVGVGDSKWLVHNQGSESISTSSGTYFPVYQEVTNLWIWGGACFTTGICQRVRDLKINN